MHELILSTSGYNNELYTLTASKSYMNRDNGSSYISTSY